MSEVKLRLIDQLEVELKEKEIKDDSQVPNLGCQGTWGHSLVQPISLRQEVQKETNEEGTGTREALHLGEEAQTGCVDKIW